MLPCIFVTVFCYSKHLAVLVIFAAVPLSSTVPTVIPVLHHMTHAQTVPKISCPIGEIGSLRPESKLGKRRIKWRTGFPISQHGCAVRRSELWPVASTHHARQLREPTRSQMESCTAQPSSNQSGRILRDEVASAQIGTRPPPMHCNRSQRQPGRTMPTHQHVPTCESRAVALARGPGPIRRPRYPSL